MAVEAGRWYRLSFRLHAAGGVAPFPLALMQRAAPYTTYAPDVTVDPSAGRAAAIFRPKLSDPSARITLFFGTALPANAEIELSDFVFEEVRPDRDGELDVGNIIFDDGVHCGVKRWSARALAHDGDYVCEPSFRSVWLRMASPPTERY